jgi:6-phosphofructokinase 2
MSVIATLTMNPTIDVAYEVDRVFHTHKIRTTHEYYNPGGGGINVARVFVRLGGAARCIYLSGGATGAALDGLIDLHQLVRTRIPIAGDTRVAMTALEHASGKEFRFTPAGPIVREAEWMACLSWLDGIDCEYLVASGSLPPGVPGDFYAEITRIMVARGIRMVLDSSGDALGLGLAGGSLYLVKPSKGELEHLVGHSLETLDDIAAAALRIVDMGQAKLVAVTMGQDGALLARRNGAVHAAALPIEAASAVGAGDSFLAGMVHALAQGQDDVSAFRFGVAAGSAAVLRPGTGLAHPEDIRRLLPLVKTEPCGTSGPRAPAPSVLV